MAKPKFLFSLFLSQQPLTFHFHFPSTHINPDTTVLFIAIIMSSPSTSQPQDQEATVKSTTPTTTNSTTETTTESSTEKKPIQDLKFYPDNPTEFYHKAHFST